MIDIKNNKLLNNDLEVINPDQLTKTEIIQLKNIATDYLIKGFNCTKILTARTIISEYYPEIYIKIVKDDWSK